MKPHAANTRLNEFEYRQGRVFLRSWPQVIDLGLTLKCNLACAMCFSRAMDPIDLDPVCLENVIPYLDTCHRIVWNDAGELFASSRTPEFLALMKRYRPPVSYVSTNFLLIDRHIDDLLDSGLTDMSVSIDAVRRETYERIRTGARWDKLIANLELLQRKKAERRTVWPRLTFVFVAMRGNLAELPDFVDFAHTYGAVAIHVLKLLPTPTGLERTEQPAPDDERAAYKEALRRALARGIEIQHTEFNNAVLLREMGETPPQAAPGDALPGSDVPGPGDSRMALERLHNRKFGPRWGNAPICASPWREFLIQTNGAVRACCFSPAVMGDLHDRSLPDIWNGPEYQAFRRRLVLRDFSTCAGCPYLAKVLVAEEDHGDPIQREIEQPTGATSRWIASYLDDVNWLAGYFGRLRAGRKKTALRQIGAALKRLWRVNAKNLFALGRLARAWEEQRCLNRHLLERLRRASEDVAILSEVVARRAREAVAAADPSAPPLAVDAAQDPVDALFYSARFVRHATPERWKAGGQFEVPVTVLNTSASQWPTDGERAVKLAYSWYYDNGALLELDGLRTRLDRSPRPGESVEVRAVVRAPDRPGRYILTWDLVYEPYAWFKERGSLPLEVEILVEA